MKEMLCREHREAGIKPVLALITMLTLLMHALFRIQGFGEIDACKLAIYGFSWHQFGIDAIDMYGAPYPFRTSFLYIAGIKMLFDLGVKASAIPTIMTWANIITGALAVVPLYYIWEKVINRKTALLGLILMSFAPAVWQGGIYGMPHMPALFFFCGALLCFMKGIEATVSKRIVLLSISFLFSLLALGMKADIVLAYGAFGGLFLFYKQKNFRYPVIGLLVIAASFLIISILPNIVFSGALSPGRFATRWNDSFPFTIEALENIKNISASVSSVGCVFSVMILVCLILLLIRQKNKSLLLFCLVWSLPLTLFWGLKLGNSARHMMVPMIGYLFVSACILQSLVKGKKLVAIVLALIIGNYFLTSDALLPRTYRPSSRLIAGSYALQEITNKRHQIGHDFCRLPAGDKVLLGDETIFYGFWEIIHAHQTMRYEKRGNDSYYLTGSGRIKLAYTEEEDLESTLEYVRQHYAGWQKWFVEVLQDNTEFQLELVED